jgi:hypothetical protein
MSTVRFRHRLVVLDMKPDMKSKRYDLRQFRHNPTHIVFQYFLMINKFKKSYNV